MRSLWALAVVLALPALQDKKQAGTDPEQAGPDYRIQGEYAAEGANVAAQVVALGDGKFDVYVLGGGLPGAGWDPKTRLKAPAKTEGGKAVFEGNGYSGSIGDGFLNGKGPGGEFKLNRVFRRSPTEGAKPPEGAVVLFDGTSAAEWDKDKLENGVLTTFKSGNLNSKKKFGNVKVHVEFMLSFMPHARGQGRSNSGVYLAGRHEVQVLDSFGLTGESNECGGLYGVAKPAVNMCFPPLQWQTYDIEYRLATEEKGATITVLHNGVKIHDAVEFKGKTTAATDKNPPQQPGPLHLQDHGNPVFYRNIWVVELK
jgi:hypothetical protein